MNLKCKTMKFHLILAAISSKQTNRSAQRQQRDRNRKRKRKTVFDRIFQIDSTDNFAVKSLENWRLHLDARIGAIVFTLVDFQYPMIDHFKSITRFAHNVFGEKFQILLMAKRDVSATTNG